MHRPKVLEEVSSIAEQFSAVRAFEGANFFEVESSAIAHICFTSNLQRVCFFSCDMIRGVEVPTKN
jgi:hypothetical protein